jgi:hypothetical protein
VRKGSVVHVVEMACIFAECSTTTGYAPATNQKDKFALAINACWQTSSMTCVLHLPTLLKNIFNTWLAASDSQSKGSSIQNSPSLRCLVPSNFFSLLMCFRGFVFFKGIARIKFWTLFLVCVYLVV